MAVHSCSTIHKLFYLEMFYIYGTKCILIFLLLTQWECCYSEYISTQYFRGSACTKSNKVNYRLINSTLFLKLVLQQWTGNTIKCWQYSTNGRSESSKHLKIILHFNQLSSNFYMYIYFQHYWSNDIFYGCIISVMMIVCLLSVLCMYIMYTMCFACALRYSLYAL